MPFRELVRGAIQDVADLFTEPDGNPTPLHWEEVDGIICAESVFHDAGMPLLYALIWDGAEWKATLDGATISTGMLQVVLRACQTDFMRSIRSSVSQR